MHLLKPQVSEREARWTLRGGDGGQEKERVGVSFMKRSRDRWWGGRSPGTVALAAFALLLGTLCASTAGAQAIRYLYDLKGQIIGIVDADGSVATYSWDESQNLVGITRTDAASIPGPIGITLVSPNQGLPTDVIEIFGKGLASPTSVTFNGVAATVQESNANYIRSAVPAGATTGIIHVVTALGAADSPTPFTILAPLTITPTNVSLPPGGTQQFTASGPAVWSVEGAVGSGSPQVGTITAAGLYTAPSTGTLIREVRVAAQSPGDPLNRAEASVFILPTIPTIRSPWVSVARGEPFAAALPVPPVSVGVGQPFAAALPVPPVSVAVGQPLAAALPVPPVATQREPVITAVSPASIARGAANVTLTLTGRGLATPRALQFLLNNANDTLITYTNLTALPDGTQATFTIRIEATAVIGDRVLRITAGGVSSTPEGTVGNMLQVTGP